MNKKTILLLLSIILVGGLVFVGMKVVSGSGSSIESELIDFAIKDTDNIDRIVITDQFGRAMDLIKPKDGDWTDKDGNCIMQEGIHYIIDACKKIEFKGYLSEAAAENHKQMMLTNHMKVDYYINGKWNKTWYIGPPTKDHLGQIMLLDSKELGKSDKPVIMSIKGMYGIIEPRFYADPMKWQCTQVFNLIPQDIKKVEVNFPLQPARSFSVETLAKNRYSVKQQNIPLAHVDTQFVMLYLNKFKKIHYEIPNYILNDQQVDSLKRSSPFCILTIDLQNGQTKKMKMFRIMSDREELNEFGQVVNHQVDSFWGELPNGEIVKCQYFVFDPLTLGHLYFPLDLSGIDLNNYDVKSPDQYHDLRNK